jgi:F-type H+-transporting ATPase subunit epsilon
MGILTGHVSMLTALDHGVLRLRDGKEWTAIALMGGFAEVDANEVTVLVNAAELGSGIDQAAAEEEFRAAEERLASMEGQPPSSEKLKAQEHLARSRARLQAARGS